MVTGGIETGPWSVTKWWLHERWIEKLFYTQSQELDHQWVFYRVVGFMHVVDKPSNPVMLPVSAAIESVEKRGGIVTLNLFTQKGGFNLSRIP
jgi:hypothetical protein